MDIDWLSQKVVEEVSSYGLEPVAVVFWDGEDAVTLVVEPGMPEEYKHKLADKLSSLPVNIPKETLREFLDKKKG